MDTRESILASLTTPRQDMLNQLRWFQFLSMGISLQDKTIFEPGAGIGDQTAWLLKQGVKSVIVNDGRQGNLDIIRERFNSDPRVSFLLGDLETCLDQPLFQFHVDFIFCYGVYYHIQESYPQWHIMRRLAKMGDAIAFDYLLGTDNHFSYGYDNPSTSLSRWAFRPKTETLIRALKDIWGHAYLPKDQLKWCDPTAPETRLIAVASHAPVDSGGLILQ